MQQQGVRVYLPPGGQKVKQKQDTLKRANNVLKRESLKRRSMAGSLSDLISVDQPLSELGFKRRRRRNARPVITVGAFTLFALRI